MRGHTSQQVCFASGFNRDPHFQRVMRRVRGVVCGAKQRGFNRDPHFQRVMQRILDHVLATTEASIGTLIFRG